MTEKEKYEQLTLFMLNEEKTIQNELIKSYEVAYKEIKTSLQHYINMGDGNLSKADMFKYNRYENLLKEIESILGSIEHYDLNNLDKFVFKNYEHTYHYSGYILETEYQKKLSFSVLNENRIKKSIENPLAKISLQNNSEVVKQQLKQVITQSIVKGDGMRKVSENMKKVLDKNANNVFRIYQTETTRINNQANLDSMKHAKNKGLELRKKWVSTLDKKTRTSHQKLDGEVRNLDETFSNDLMYPGDPKGEAKDVINCRCTMITVLKGFENVYSHRRARQLKVEKEIDGKKETHYKNEKIKYKNYEEWKSDLKAD